MARHRAPSPIAPETALLPQIGVDRSPILPYTLGNDIVHYTAYVDKAVANADYFRATGTPAEAQEAVSIAGVAQAQAGEILDSIRTRVTESPPNHDIDVYLQGAFGTAFEQARSQGAQHHSIRAWLGDKDAGATDRQLYGFLVQHVEHIANMQQSPEVARVVEQAKKKYVEGVRHAVSMGLYVPEALASLPRVEQARVVIGDVWDEYIAQGNIAYHFLDTDYIVVSQYSDIEGKGLRDGFEGTLLHEFDHLHFLPSIKQMQMPSSFLEGMAEHVRLAVDTGYWHEFNPYVRPADSGIYTNERVLQDVINNNGGERIPAELAIRAHSAPAGHPAWTEYSNAVRRSWGMDIHGWAQARIDQYIAEQTTAGYPKTDATTTAYQRVQNEMYHSEHRKEHGSAHRIGRHVLKSRRSGRRLSV